MKPLGQTRSMRLKLSSPNTLGFLARNLTGPWARRLPLGRLIRGLLRGYDAEHVLLFDLDRKGWDHFLPDQRRYRLTHCTNLDVWPILHDKLIFDSFMRGRLPVVEALFFIHRGRIHDLHGGLDWPGFLECCRQGGRFVIKAAQGGMGDGLLFVEGMHSGGHINGNYFDEINFQLRLRAQEYHVVYPVLETHDDLRAVFPDSKNALRVTVFVDQEGCPRLLAPVWCIGTRASAPLEHFRHGGISAQIDEESGRCTQALRRGLDGRLERLERHPDTGVAIRGIQIPFWHEIQDTLLEFHRRLPAFDCVGWDILVGAKGFHIIEGNHNPGLRIPLMHRNLSQEPLFGEFLRSRGILNTTE
jgi:hypothetical protein